MSNKDPEADRKYKLEPVSGKKQTVHAVGQGMPFYIVHCKALFLNLKQITLQHRVTRTILLQRCIPRSRN